MTATRTARRLQVHTATRLRPVLVLRRQDVERLREWRSRPVPGVSTFSRTSLPLAAALIGSLAVALLACEEPSPPAATTSYAVLLYSAPCAPEPIADAPTQPDSAERALEAAVQKVAEPLSESPCSAPPVDLPALESPASAAPAPAQPTPSVVPEVADVSEDARTAARNAVASNYCSLVHAIVAKSLRYPTVARMRRIEGEVTVRLTIDAEGRLASLAEQSATGTMLSEIVLAAVRRGAPYPAPPASLGAPVTFDVPVSFRLRP